MKPLKILITLMVLSVSFYSCDKVEDIFELPLPYSLDETIAVNGANGGYTKTITINATDDGNISDNLDNIKSYTVESLSITVDKVVANDETAKITGLDIEFKNANGSVVISSKTELKLIAIAAAGKTNLELDADTLLGIKAMIETGEDITMAARITVENGPASFDFTLSIEGIITVGA